jgi:hypothetical protein
MKWGDERAARKHDDPHRWEGEELDAATAADLRALVRAFAAQGDLPTEPYEVARRALWLQRLAYWARRRYVCGDDRQRTHG